MVGAVAEEADHDAVEALHLVGQRRAGGDRDAARDDAVGAEVAGGDVGDVHRAAAAAAVAGLLAEQLGHHLLEVGALGDAVAVAAVGRGDRVVGAQGEAGAGGRGLLADREVHGAVHQAAGEQVVDGLLEAADAPHGPDDVARCVGAGDR